GEVMTSVFSRRRIVTLLVALVTLTALLAGPAQAKFKSKRELTVMSQNLYLGASLAPAIELAFHPSPTAEQFVTAVATIYGEALSTDFPARSKAIAAEIAATRPDIIGLQEVSNWTVLAGPGTPVGFVPPVPSLDFLTILMGDLAVAGLDYSVAAVSHNASLGPFPLALCDVTNPFACLVHFQDRDVILVSNDTPGLAVSNSASGRYSAQVVLDLLGQELSFDRGWAFIDGTFEGKKFRFLNTHLETEDFAAVQETQAAEFLAGPADAPGAVIAVGDFNSAADGTSTASYGMLTSSFDDAWRANRQAPGFTCCQASDLANKKSELSSRIDLVLTRDVARSWPAHLVLNKRFQKQSAPFWASDHAGVLAVIQIG
ncbi:MAG: endonuclease/exonuclease/phosphatase family protein, partial [Acidimicrobiia bacterium]